MERGSISNLADARLGLNNAKILGLRIRGDRDIAITCGAVAFEFHNGKGKSGVILLDTEETHVDGVGTLDLRTQQLDMLLTPQLKKPAIFSSQKSIRYRVRSRTPPGRSSTVSPWLTRRRKRRRPYTLCCERLRRTARKAAGAQAPSLRSRMRSEKKNRSVTHSWLFLQTWSENFWTVGPLRAQPIGRAGSPG